MRCVWSDSRHSGCCKTACTVSSMLRLRSSSLLTRCDELKVVYLGQDLAQYDNITATHRYLQPCWTEDLEKRQHNLHATVQAVLDNPEWRLSLQTHRLLGIK